MKTIKVDTEIDGKLTIKDYTLPLVDGTAGQVPTTDGAGNVGFATPSAGGSGAFSSNGTLITETAAEYDVGFVIGSPQLDDDGNADHKNRMFFNKSKGAFRVGRCWTNVWDDINVGQNSHAEGDSTTASGSTSHAEGYYTTASGEYSHAEGRETIASEYISHAEGSNTIASGSASHAEGSNTIASGSASHAEGSGSLAYLESMSSHGSGAFDNSGDAQNSKIQVRKETLDATTSELTITSNPLSRLILPENRTWGFEISLIARQTAGTAGAIGDSKFFHCYGNIKRDGANNTILVGATVANRHTDTNASTWTVAVSADDTNESLKIDVTGEIDKTIHWVAKVELVEVG